MGGTCTKEGNCSSLAECVNSFVRMEQDTTNSFDDFKNIKHAVRIQTKFRQILAIKKLLSIIKLNNPHQAKSIPANLNSMNEMTSKFVISKENELSEISFSNEIISKYRICPKFEPVFLSDGSIYHGQWDSTGTIHGIGTLIYKNGSKYIGEFKKGQKCGKGRLYQRNGDYYDGYFDSDQFNGFGIFEKLNYFKYEGEWKNDLQNGEGEESYRDGTKYIGTFINGEKNGQGEFYWSDGSKYKGNFLNGEIDGYGTYEWFDGKKYVGAWKKNKMHGFGIFTWPDGKRYEGNYANDKKCGYGIYQWNEFKVYEGNWDNGKRHGLGTLRNGNETKKGIWCDGEFVKNFEQNDLYFEFEKSKIINKNETKNRIICENFLKNKNTGKTLVANVISKFN